MNVERFEQLLERRIERLKATVLAKRAEYALTHADVLRNFKHGASLQRETPQQTCLGYMTKHLVSVVDLVEGRTLVSEAVADEKLGDVMVYLLLLEAIFTENRETVVG